MNTGKYVLLNFESTIYSLDKNLTLTFGSNISINICVTLQLRVLHSLKQNKCQKKDVSLLSWPPTSHRCKLINSWSVIQTLLLWLGLRDRGSSLLNIHVHVATSLVIKL